MESQKERKGLEMQLSNENLTMGLGSMKRWTRLLGCCFLWNYTVPIITHDWASGKENESHHLSASKNIIIYKQVVTKLREQSALATKHNRNLGVNNSPWYHFCMEWRAPRDLASGLHSCIWEFKLWSKHQGSQINNLSFNTVLFISKALDNHFFRERGNRRKN